MFSASTFCSVFENYKFSFLESPVLCSNNGDESSWICSLVLHSRWKEKYKKNNESALKSASLRISVDKRRGRKNQKILLDKLFQSGKSKNIPEKNFLRIAVFKIFER